MAMRSNVIELQVTSGAPPAGWNDHVRACRGTIFHAAEWASYSLLGTPAATPEFYSWRDERGEIAGVALGFHSVSRRRVAAPFSGHRWLDALPAARDGQTATVTTMIRDVERQARRARDVTLRIGSFASANSEQALAPVDFHLSRRFEFELDITADEKALWEAMDYKRRKNIKKAMRSSVAIRLLPVEEGAAHLRRLQAASFERVVARGGPSLAPQAAGQDPMAALTSAGVGHVVGAFVDDACVSASFFTTFNGLAYHTLSGHNGKALETQAPTLLLWETILRLRAEGLERLNFGGCSIGAIDDSSPEHGVYTYKKAFGGAQVECANGDKILRPLVHRMRAALQRVAE